MRILLPAAGALLLGLLFVDVFATVFHAAGRGGPINRRQNRLLWNVFRRIGIRRDGTPRRALLAYGGPTLVALTLVVWTVWLVVGFALVYLPFVGLFLVSPGEPGAPWVEALYYSGYTAATLGLGDVVADTAWLRLTTIVQAMSGFALFSLSITYLLSVYGDLGSARATASGIAGYFRGGVSVTLTRVEQAGAEPFARWCEGVTTMLLLNLQARFQYPVLNYFYSIDRSRALAVQVGHLLEVEARLADPPSATLRTLADHPSYVALGEAVRRLLLDTEAHFVPASFARSTLDDAAPATTRAHRRILGYMAYEPARAEDRG